MNVVPKHYARRRRMAPDTLRIRPLRVRASGHPGGPVLGRLRDRRRGTHRLTPDQTPRPPCRSSTPASHRDALQDPQSSTTCVAARIGRGTLGEVPRRGDLKCRVERSRLEKPDCAAPAARENISPTV